MARPLTGSSWMTPGGHHGRELPAERGSTRRVKFVFRSEATADFWLEAGKEALQTGEPLPVPSPFQLVLTTAKPQPSAVGTLFRGMAAAYAYEKFQELQRAGGAREKSVLGHIDKIATWMEERDLVIETMVRDQVKAMTQRFARAPKQAPAPIVPDGHDPDQLVTMAEALTLPGVPSKATPKRRKAAGTLVSQVVDGEHRFRLADLYTRAVGAGVKGGLRQGRSQLHGMHQDVLADVIRVYDEVCLYARDHGVAVPNDRESLALHKSDRPDSPKVEPVDLVICAAIAGRLHAIHQVALWIMRILGLRISEAYGLTVEDLLDHGPGRPGVLLVHRQGGRTFEERDRSTGELVMCESIDRTKTEASVRVLVVPQALMAQLREIIRIFHTDEDGNVRRDARVIPGLTRADASGQGGFRNALTAATKAVGLELAHDDADGALSVNPHTLRKSVISELAWAGMKAAHRRRFAGHRLGDDVHARVYVLDDPLLRTAKKVAKVSQRLVEKELPAGLMVPTVVRCTTANQRLYAADARRIDAELIEAGWLVIPESEGEPLLGATDIAPQLGVTVQTVRRWMADGTLPSIHISDRARGEDRRARLSVVVAIRDALRSRVTLQLLSEELAVAYLTLYQYVKAHGLTLEPLGARGYLVPPETAEMIRAHYARQAALRGRAVPLSTAAARLDAAHAVVTSMLATGELEEDERGHDGRRMVTIASLELLLAGRPATR